MTTSRNPFEDAMPSVLAEVNAVDGIPLGKKLTAAQLSAMRTALGTLQESEGKGSHWLVLAGGLGYVDRSKKTATEDQIVEACTRHFGRYPDKQGVEPIHLVLDSRGGSLDSAYRTVLFLRRFTGELRVHVPRRAKSAATLIALGANEVSMSPFAELGPLDTQIKDPRNPSKDVSALDCYQSVDYVREFGLQTLPKVLAVLLGETQARIPLQDLIRTATDFALGEVRPMLEQVKALDFGAWGRTLKIGETYARALQLSLDVDGDEPRADRVARRLVYGYPHHPFPIDITEAQDIGLDVSLMPADRYSAMRAIVEACEDSRFVGFLGDVEEMLKDVERAIPAPRQDADLAAQMEPNRNIAEQPQPTAYDSSTGPVEPNPGRDDRYGDG